MHFPLALSSLHFSLVEFVGVKVDMVGDWLRSAFVLGDVSAKDQGRLPSSCQNKNRYLQEDSKGSELQVSEVS